ncbi:hypothetical protein M408DRAFT_110829 [Serendipita vermifera MAFF 305830]|uniref:Uncharacterized protein n=1 Tax=Serendipita vermifera MAFF 305830 TaxID=933852 RepID=A0A0C3AMC5_SERVB|nr:hypothetical protein M408DRAFT_110829 [Serendipita vermifera MAFF 305830]
MSLLLTRRVIFVGDPKVGKTGLIRALSEAELLRQSKVDVQNHPGGFGSQWKRLPYNPQVDGEYTIYYQRDRRRIGLRMMEVKNHVSAGRVRPFYYIHGYSAVIVLCYAIDAPRSLASVHEKWHPELLHFLPGVPIILVGCKSDLQGIQRNDVVTRSQGEALAAEIGAVKFIECSSQLCLTIDEFEETLVQVALSLDTATSSRRLRKGKCIVM